MEDYLARYDKQEVRDDPISGCSCERSDLGGGVQELSKIIISR